MKNLLGEDEDGVVSPAGPFNAACAPESSFVKGERPETNEGGSASGVEM